MVGIIAETLTAVALVHHLHFSQPHAKLTISKFTVLSVLLCAQHKYVYQEQSTPLLPMTTTEPCNIRRMHGQGAVAEVL